MSDCSTHAFDTSPIRGEIRWTDGQRPSELSYARYVNGQERKAEYVELDGVKYVPERTCHIECYDDGLDEGLDGEWFSYDVPRFYLSCGHTSAGTEMPGYCEECGARVRDE